MLGAWVNWLASLPEEAGCLGSKDEPGDSQAAVVLSQLAGWIALCLLMK